MVSAGEFGPRVHSVTVLDLCHRRFQRSATPRYTVFASRGMTLIGTTRGVELIFRDLIELPAGAGSWSAMTVHRALQAAT
jgi:hypothetical protein